MEENFICTTCGIQYAATAAEPKHCLICEDDRQYVNWQGQQWTLMEDLKKDHQNIIEEVEPGLFQISTQPKFGIGQKAFLLQSPGGNILWDCLSLLDEATIAHLQHLRGIKAIAISHPHYYAAKIAWTKAFGNVPVYIHARDQQWVVHPDKAINLWQGTYLELWDNIKIINCGGHFPGACVLHWPAGAENKGILLSGDSVQVAMDRKSVSFMYSYPNMIPLRRAEILAIRDSMRGFTFEKIYGAFDPHVPQAARPAFDRSIERYLQVYE
jgi:glyoxylase-like metal-dependent hydrolase (beta-lactamase superfamily II)